MTVEDTSAACLRLGVGDGGDTSQDGGDERGRAHVDVDSRSAMSCKWIVEDASKKRVWEADGRKKVGMWEKKT